MRMTSRLTPPSSRPSSFTTTRTRKAATGGWVTCGAGKKTGGWVGGRARRVFKGEAEGAALGAPGASWAGLNLGMPHHVLLRQPWIPPTQTTGHPNAAHLFGVAGVPLQDGQQESVVWVAWLNCFPRGQPRQQALHVLP
jgi:hypothetical protein